MSYTGKSPGSHVRIRCPMQIVYRISSPHHLGEAEEWGHDMIKDISELLDMLRSPFSEEPDKADLFPTNGPIIGKYRVATFDERGDLGRTFGKSNGENSSDVLLMVITETDNLEDLLKIAIKYPRNTKYAEEENDDELKAHTSLEYVWDGVLNDLAGLDLDVYMLSTRKKRFVVKKRPSKIYKQSMERLAQAYLERTDADCVLVLIDDNSMLRGNAGVRIFEDSAKERDIVIKPIQIKSIDCPAIWPQDFITGAAGHYEETGSPAQIERIAGLIRFWERKNE